MLEFNIDERQPKILYIGSGDSNPGAQYMWALEQIGFKVYHVGDNARDFDTKNLPTKPFRVHTEVGNAGVQIKQFSLKSLLDLVGYDWDAIIHVQNWLYFTEKELSPIPYFFYCTEIAYPRVPRCAWHVLCSTYMIKKIVKRDCRWVRSFIYHPHAAPTRVLRTKYPFLKRPIKSSFAGELYSLPLYKQRREIVKYLEKNVTDFEAHYLGPFDPKSRKRKAEVGNGRLSFIEYINLMRKSECSLNVPSIGGSNFRDLEILLSGSMLVTMETPDLLLMGIEDGHNCRTYETKEEAAEILKQGWDPKIAKNGWKTIFFGRDWWQHNDINVAKHIQYKGHVKTKSKQYLRFEIKDGIELGDHLKDLLEQKLITKYKFDGQKYLLLFISDSKKKEEIFTSLGFIQWHVDGHTLFHRMKEIATYMSKTANVPIPKRINVLLKMIEDQREETLAYLFD